MNFSSLNTHDNTPQGVARQPKGEDMKTLADLKREAKNYTWEMYFNSWGGGYLKPGAKLYGLHRKVVSADTVKLGFESPTGVSYLEWPKASELSITDQVCTGGQVKQAGHGEYIVSINPANEQGCIIHYHLRPVQVLQTV